MEVSEIINIIEKHSKTFKGDTTVIGLIMNDVIALQDKHNKGEMTMLGERNYALISDAVKSMGSFDPQQILFIFEERLYVHEGAMIEEFLQWVVDGEWLDRFNLGKNHPIRAFGHGNYEEKFTEFLKSR